MAPKSTIKKFHDNFGNTIALEAAFPIVSRSRQGYWSFYSPQFKTLGYSTESEAAALEDFRTNLNNFFQIHVELGTLEKALFTLNWRKEDSGVFAKPKLFNTLASQKNTREFAIA